MKLKRLILQGFKSFKDRTTIHFDQGITGIVGPNGCGKSNIVDALFWVMGEQSAKHLRGQLMKDLIFSGSDRYGPGAWAEVSLILGNEEGRPIRMGSKISAPSEIQMTRKLYRNGETEYRINGHPCRLKDIQEVFMDTGTGAKSYSIIAQGEVERLVQAKPEERRAMIEEVAGITRFKARKKESLRKIEQTQSNLGRLIDLKIEIEKHLNSLKDQAEKAQQARELKKAMEDNELIVNAHKEFELLRGVRDNKIKLNEKVLELESWRLRKNDVELTLEQERARYTQLAEEIEQLGQDLNAFSKKVATSEERQEHLFRDRAERESLIETRKRESQELREEQEGRRLRLEELQKQRQELESRQRGEGQTLALSQNVTQLKGQLLAKEKDQEDLQRQIEEEREQLSEIEQEIARISSRREEYANGLKDVAQERESLQDQLAEFSHIEEGEKGELGKIQAHSEELAWQKKELLGNFEKLRGKKAQRDTAYRDTLKEEMEKDSLLHSLQELNASLEGVGEGASEFLREGRRKGGRKEGEEEEKEGHQILANLIHCDPSMALAVERLLGPLADVLVSVERDYRHFFEWRGRRTGPLKRVELLMGGGEKKEEDGEVEALRQAIGADKLIPLNQVATITIQGKSTPQLTAFLQGFYIADTLDEKAMANNLPFDHLLAMVNFKGIASKDGSILVKNVDGTVILGLSGESSSASGGIIERNHKMAELHLLLKDLRQDLAAKGQAQKDIVAQLEEAEKAYEQARDLTAQTQARVLAQKAALQSRQSGIASLNSRLELLKKRQGVIMASQEKMEPEEETLKGERECRREGLDQKGKQLRQQVEELKSSREAYERERDSLVEKQGQAKGAGEQLHALMAQMADVEEQIIRFQNRLQSNGQLIENYEDDVTKMTREWDTLAKKNRQSRLLLQEKEKGTALKKEEGNRLMENMREREREVKDLASQMTGAEKNITQLQIAIGQYVAEEEQVVKNIFELYRIDLRRSVALHIQMSMEDFNSWAKTETETEVETEVEVESVPYTFTPFQRDDLKECERIFKRAKSEYSKLGDINWQSIEDYTRQKKRFDFLQQQEGELRRSLKDLEKAITHIDEKSRERFKTAFHEVDLRFGKVFPIIFGGGMARLRVAGDLDDPECGVDIIAQPQGKRMQSIGLMSGGEKALTAMSLIFSIFLVKPSPFCLLDEVDAPLDDANVGRFNELLREMSGDSQFILITHNKRTMELNDTLYGVTMEEPGISKTVSVQIQQ